MSKSIMNKDDVECNGTGDMPDIHPKMNMDDAVEEVTRKIAPTMIMPSLKPLPTMPTATTINEASAMISTSSNTKGSPSTTAFGRYGLELKQQQDAQSKPPSPSQQQPKGGFERRPFLWTLSSVPTLPEFHSLERTAVFVPTTIPSDVSSRISVILRERSIEAQYDDAKAKVKCTTAEGVDFRIRLYRGRGRYSHGIIVEVQRRFGTSLVFHNDTISILDGAVGKVVSPPPALNPPPPPSSSSPLLSSSHTVEPPSPCLMRSSNNLPKVSDEDIDDADADANDNDNDDLGSSHSSSPYTVPSADSSLAMVAKMMHLEGFDSQYLGLQTLSPLVDSEKLSLSTARAVATKLLQPENEVGVKVVTYITNNTNCRKSTNIDGKKKKACGIFDDDDDENDDDTDYMILRNMCLNILANSLRAYGTVPDSFIRSCTRALVHDLINAEKHPNTALLSAKCMEYFAQAGHTTTITTNNNNNNNNTADVYEAFKIALKVGEERHVNLMRQARKCMVAIR